MMKYYQELSLLPQDETPMHFLWSKVYQQIHLGLVEVQDSQGRVPIGVSFPEYVTGEKFSILGGKLRLFAKDEAALVQFNATKWLARLSDYIHCTNIRQVPSNIKGYVTFQREQHKTGSERLSRRFAKRLEKHKKHAEEHGVVYDHANALQGYEEMAHKPIATPFIRLQSLSSGKSFCLWIKKTIASESVMDGFSSYGLSASSTVPEF